MYFQEPELVSYYFKGFYFESILLMFISWKTIIPWGSIKTQGLPTILIGSPSCSRIPIDLTYSYNLLPRTPYGSHPIQLKYMVYMRALTIHKEKGIKGTLPLPSLLHLEAKYFVLFYCRDKPTEKL